MRKPRKKKTAKKTTQATSVKARNSKRKLQSKTKAPKAKKQQSSKTTSARKDLPTLGNDATEAESLPESLLFLSDSEGSEDNFSNQKETLDEAPILEEVNLISN